MDKISYVEWWLKRVNEEMLTKPGYWFRHWTHINYSGGLTGWEEFVDDVYFRPNGLEECLLQGEVHGCMLRALDTALSQAERHSTDLDVARAYRIARMVSLHDPLVAAAAKVRLNRMCVRLKRSKTLLHEARRGFGVLIMSRPELCLEW